MARLAEMRRKGYMGLALLVPLFLSLAFVYWYATSDEYERSCGLTNAFKTDFSRQISEAILTTEDEMGLRVDFSKLTDWKTVCLTSMYEDDFNFTPSAALTQVSYWMGRSQCRGNPSGSVTVLLVTADGGGIARKFHIPVQRTIVETNYSMSQLPTQFQQCSDIQNAIARCARPSSAGSDRCLLLFPK